MRRKPSGHGQVARRAQQTVGKARMFAGPLPKSIAMPIGRASRPAKFA